MGFFKQWPVVSLTVTRLAWMYCGILPVTPNGVRFRLDHVSFHQEFHFLCECETYSALREDLFKSINEFCPGFEDMEPRQNFVYI